MATSVHGGGNWGRLLPDILLTGNSLLNEYIDNCASSYYDFWKIITLFTRGPLYMRAATTVASEAAHCEPMHSAIVIARVLW